MKRKDIMILLTLILFSFTAFSAGKTILIEKGDLLKIQTRGIEEYNFLKYVDATGSIVLPYIGKVRVEGQSTDRIAKIIQTKLNDGYFREPEVMVEIERSSAKKIFIFGLVRDAGEYQYENGMRMLQLISKAGGYLGDVDGLIVKIFRQNKKVGIFRLNNLISYNRVNYNVELLPDDIVCILSGEEDEEL